MSYYVYQEKSSVNNNGNRRLTRTTTQWSNKNGDKTFYQSRSDQTGKRESKIVIEGKYENGDYALSETEYLNGQTIKVSKYRLSPKELNVLGLRQINF